MPPGGLHGGAENVLSGVSDGLREVRVQDDVRAPRRRDVADLVVVLAVRRERREAGHHARRRRGRTGGLRRERRETGHHVAGGTREDHLSKDPKTFTVDLRVQPPKSRYYEVTK